MNLKLHRLVWLVPLAAAAGAVYYARDAREQNGRLLTIEFADASGLTSDARVLHKGVEIGKIVGVELSADKSRAEVQVRLERSQSAFAEEGAAFWVVSPEISEHGFGGLNTLFSGPYIDSIPGKGKIIADFVGSRGAPEPGLNLLLRAPRLNDLRPGTPASYRGIQVGVVRDIRLSKDADSAEVRLLIWKRYGPLVRTHSKFWVGSGVDLKGGLLRGVEFKVDSLRELVFGEIAFATPDKDSGAPARDGARFDLEDQPQKEWLSWTPRIPIEPTGTKEVETESRLPTGRDLLDSKLK